jgi:hypothetical protein
MSPRICPKCGREIAPDVAACSACGCLVNGIAPATPVDGRLTPEQRAWALQQFSDEQLFQGIREVLQGGGLELKDFIHELEREANGRE